MTLTKAQQARCTAIADRVVPAYRDGKRSYSCTGTVAKMWQAAWDGARAALSGDPADYAFTTEECALIREAKVPHGERVNFVRALRAAVRAQ